MRRAVIHLQAGVMQQLLGCEAVLPMKYQLQLQSHGLGQKQVLAGFDQATGRLALVLRGRVGVFLLQDVAGSKSTGTGRLCCGFQGRTSMGSPISAKHTRLPRPNPSCWCKALCVQV